MVKRVKKYIQKAHLKKGALHRQLGIALKQQIPFELLYAIVITPIGHRLRNPTRIGKRSMTVTSLLWHRANMAFNMLKRRK